MSSEVECLPVAGGIRENSAGEFLSSAPQKSTAAYYLQIRRWAFVLHKPRHRGGELASWGQNDCWAQEG